MENCIFRRLISMAKNFVAMESDLDKYVEDKVNSLIGGGGNFIVTNWER